MSSISIKRPKLCGNKCVMCGKSKFSHPGLKLFIFPRKDVERCEKWINTTGYFELKYLPLEAKRYVCELHFDDKDFMSILKNRLMPNAIPKKNNHQNILVTSKSKSYYRTSSKQDEITDKNDNETNLQQNINMGQLKNSKQNENCDLNGPVLDSNSLLENSSNDAIISKLTINNHSKLHSAKTSIEFIPMIQPYYKKNCRPVPCRNCKRKDKTIFALRKRIRDLKGLSFKNRIDQLKNISKDSKTFAKMFLTHGKHRIWTEDEKTFAIDLLNKSPSAYYYLRHNKKLILPSKASIQSWIKERSKVSENIISSSKPEDDINLNIKDSLQENENLLENNIISSIDTVSPLTCTVEIPMTYPNNILSIPNVSNDASQQIQTLTTLEPIATNLHNLSNNMQAHHVQTDENIYKQTYQIITQDGLNIKSAYIIHLNKT